MTQTQPDLAEAPAAALARVVSDLEPTDAAILRSAFEGMFSRCDAWAQEARLLVVTNEEETHKMKRARVLRLEIRKDRVEADRRRKALKESSLRKGRAIDGAYRIFEALAAPLEEQLLEAETFADRAAKAREDALAEARAAALTALGVMVLPAGLGSMTEDLWGPVLEDARLAKAAREQKAREDEESRAEAERLTREKRAKEAEEARAREAERVAREQAQVAENERLRAEAEERDREARVERQKHEAALEKERAERQRAEDAARMAQAEQERLARESRAREEAAARAREQAELAPDREKLLALAATLREIRVTLTQPKAVELGEKIRQRLGKLAGEIEKAAAGL